MSDKIIQLKDDDGNNLLPKTEIARVTGLQFALNGKADSVHTHTIANVTGLQAAINGKEASGTAATAVSSHNGANDAHSALFAAKANANHNQNATTVNVADAGGYFNGTNAEAVLQEIGQTINGIEALLEDI